MNTLISVLGGAVLLAAIAFVLIGKFGPTEGGETRKELAAKQAALREEIWREGQEKAIQPVRGAPGETPPPPEED